MATTAPPAENGEAEAARAVAVLQQQAPQLQADELGILPIIPRNIEEASRYASGMIRANIVPDSFRIGGKRDGDPDQPLILMGVLKCLELGLPPLTGIAWLLPINGRFTIWGDGAVALIQQRKLVAKHTERAVGPSFDPDLPMGEWPAEYGWTVSYWRVGQEEPYVGTFTVRDAKRGGMWMNSYKKPWIQYPNRMLFNRARAFALRDGFADALAGLGIAEEVRDHAPEPVDGGTIDSTRHRDALNDEPVTQAIEHQPDASPKPEPEKQPADLLDKNF